MLIFTTTSFSCVLVVQEYNRSNVIDHFFFLILLKFMWFLKSPWNQNSIVIHLKSNEDFKSHVNLGG